MRNKKLAVLPVAALILITGVAISTAETDNVRVIIKVNEKFDENVILVNGGKDLSDNRG